MRKSLIAMVVALLLVAVSPAALADGPNTGKTYLALGDSVAAGTQQPAPFTENGYTDNLYKHLRGEYGFDDFVNLACPGDDTVEMRSGIGSYCYGALAFLPPGGTSQLAAAVAYLTAHPGDVGLITIVMGANDILACDPTADPAVLNACIATQLGQIGANLPVIIGTLKAAAPGVPIVAMNYYNPNLAYWITGPAGQSLATSSLGLTTVFNNTLQAVYGAFGVPVVDVATTFKTFKTNGGDPPQNVRTICALTLMCEKSGSRYVLSDYDPGTSGPQPDIHPSDRGYRRIASAHAQLIDDLAVLD